LTEHGYSPTTLYHFMYTTAEVKSHHKASKLLGVLNDVSISGRHMNRLAEEIGLAMAAQRDREVEDFVHHRRQPPAAAAPPVAVIGLDGGRVLTRASGQGPGVHGHGWKEDKIACLQTMEGATFSTDPHPEPPRCFLDAPKVDEMVRDIQTNHGKRQENELPQLEELALAKAASAAAATRPTVATPAAAGMPAAAPAWPPQRAENSRTCVATMQDCHAFGKMVAAEAYRRNFHAAKRGALLGDGSAWIWNQHHKWFSYLTPIADFVHPLTYLYVTATAVSVTVSARWQQYVAWMTQCWQGGVADVITDLEARLAALEPYPETGKLPATDPREVLRRTIGYLRNNQEHMHYAEYRQQGLPVTSSLVESLIKEINYRVKGTEKFWDDPEGAEAILQLRAAVLSDDNRLETFILSRPGSATRCHQEAEYRQAA